MLATELLEVSLEAVAEFGSPVTLTKVGNRAYNVQTGKVTGATTSHQTSCISENKGRWLNGTTVGEKYIFIANQGLPFVPAPADSFTHMGETFSILKPGGVNAIEIAGEVVAYEIWGVRG